MNTILYRMRMKADWRSACTNTSRAREWKQRAEELQHLGSVFPQMSQNSFVSEDAFEAEEEAPEPLTTTADQVNKPAQVLADHTETDEQPQEKRAAVEAECDALDARKAARVEQHQATAGLTSPTRQVKYMVENTTPLKDLSDPSKSFEDMLSGLYDTESGSQQQDGGSASQPISLDSSSESVRAGKETGRMKSAADESLDTGSASEPLALVSSSESAGVDAGSASKPIALDSSSDSVGVGVPEVKRTVRSAGEQHMIDQVAARMEGRAASSSAASSSAHRGERALALAAPRCAAGGSMALVDGGGASSQMEVDPPTESEHPVWGRQMCLAGDATQLKPHKEGASVEELTTDGAWFTADRKQITLALEETKRYKDELMDAGMRALSWGDARSPAWMRLKEKAQANRLSELRATFLCGTNEGAMNLWCNDVAWQHAKAVGATVANGKVFEYEDKNARAFDAASVGKLRSGGFEKMVFIIGVPFLYAGSEQPDVEDEEPEPLQLSATQKATGATLLVPTRFEYDASINETLVMVRPHGQPTAAEIPLNRHRRRFGTRGEKNYAETETYKARPFACVVPHIVQGMQFPEGVIVSMEDWWPCDHMLYVAMSRATSSDLVELRGFEEVTTAQWAKYTSVDAKAVLLRAWGGEEPPPEVLSKALSAVKRQVAKLQARRESVSLRMPYDLDEFVVGGGMKGAQSKDKDGRRGLCGLWLTYKQCVAIDVLNAGYTLVLIGAAGTGKTLVLAEWALHLQQRENCAAWMVLSAASPTHASGGRLRTDMQTASVNLTVGTVAARYGLGVSNTRLSSEQVEKKAKGLKAPLKVLLRKKYGIIDEAMLLTPYRANVCAEVQRICCAEVQTIQRH